MESIQKDFNGKVDYILNSGNIMDDVTSTIVEVCNEKVVMIREGKITKEEIDDVIK